MKCLSTPRATLAAVLMIASAGLAPAAETPAPADVQFSDSGAVAQSLTGEAGDAAEGATVMTTNSLGNCVACHVISAMPDVPFQGNIGPALDGAANRYDQAQLRGIVVDAKHTFPDSMMPGFYKSIGFIRPGKDYTGKAAEEPLDPILSAEQIEDVVAYLMTLK